MPSEPDLKRSEIDKEVEKYSSPDFGSGLFFCNTGMLVFSETNEDL